MKRIEKIEQYKGKTLRIDFVEGEPAFINSEVVLDKSLRRGMELSDEDWEAVVYANDFRRARERALYLLDYKDYSYIAMFKKLSENYPEQLCYDVCDKLAELGVIDDRRYAAALARHYMEVKRFGRFRAMREMTLKGVSKTIAEEALVPYDGSVRDRLRELIEKKYLRKITDEDSVKKVKNALVRQGYSYGDINAVMGEIFEEDGYDSYT